MKTTIKPFRKDLIKSGIPEDQATRFLNLMQPLLFFVQSNQYNLDPAGDKLKRQSLKLVNKLLPLKLEAIELLEWKLGREKLIKMAKDFLPADIKVIEFLSLSETKLCSKELDQLLVDDLVGNIFANPADDYVVEDLIFQRKLSSTIKEPWETFCNNFNRLTKQNFLPLLGEDYVANMELFLWFMLWLGYTGRSELQQKHFPLLKFMSHALPLGTKKDSPDTFLILCA